MRPGDAQRPRRAASGGFTYVWALAAVAMLGIGLAALGTLHAEKARREREHEMLRIGTLYAQAIANYRRVSPGSEKHYPESIEKLLFDTRFVVPVRHLRKAYGDPVNRFRAWGLVKAPDGGVQGVHSLSEETPLRRAAVDLGVTQLRASNRYRDWHFVPRTEQP